MPGEYFGLMTLCDVCLVHVLQIEEVRQQTKAEKKRMAMAMREKQLVQLGMMVFVAVTPCLLAVTIAWNVVINKYGNYYQEHVSILQREMYLLIHHIT